MGFKPAGLFSDAKGCWRAPADVVQFRWLGNPSDTLGARWSEEEDGKVCSSSSSMLPYPRFGSDDLPCDPEPISCEIGRESGPHNSGQDACLLAGCSQSEGPSRVPDGSCPGSELDAAVDMRGLLWRGVHSGAKGMCSEGHKEGSVDG